MLYSNNTNKGNFIPQESPKINAKKDQVTFSNVFWSKHNYFVSNYFIPFTKGPIKPTHLTIGQKLAKKKTHFATFLGIEKKRNNFFSQIVIIWKDKPRAQKDQKLVL